MRAGRRQLARAAIVLLLIAGATSFAQSSSGQRLLRHLGIAGRSPGLTELAFSDPGRLPDQIGAGSHQLSLGFSISNRRAQAQSYDWRIASDGRAVGAGSVTLPGGSGVSIFPRFKLDCPGRTRTHVSVSLSTGQSVGLWLDCLPAHRSKRPTRKTP